MDELISKQQAIDALDDAEDAFGYLTRDWREVLMELPSAELDCTDCIKSGGDWDCDRVHCHKGESAQPTLDARDTQYNLPIGTDLISRAEAIDALRGYLVGKRCPDDGTLTCRLIENEVINKLPSAQPEIVRCKDCKNWDTTWTNDFSPNYHYCPMVDGVRKEDWFCADAERREDG